MLAYNTQDLDNASILHQAKKWLEHDLISKEYFEAIKTKHPDALYTPNLFIRIGLFLFTIVCLVAANSFLFLITAGFEGSGDGSLFGIRFVVHGIIMIGILELFIQQKKIFRCGIDNALLYSGTISIIGGLCSLFYNYERSDENALLLYAIIALPFLVAASVRYADVIGAASSFVCAFLIVFILVSKLGEISKMIMPFLVMLLSALVYLQTVKHKEKEAFRFWEDPFIIVEILSLVLFYMAGNYFIVRTLSEELFGMQLQEGEDIPLAFFFYAYTLLIPLAYIYLGLKRKNRILLQTGLFLVAAAVLTFKYYFSLGHHEITLTVSGIIMIAVAWGAIRYLHTPKFGITYIEDKEEQLMGKFDAEALIIAQTFSGPHTTGNDGVNMGDGNFGGGGANSDF